MDCGDTCGDTPGRTGTPQNGFRGPPAHDSGVNAQPAKSTRPTDLTAVAARAARLRDDLDRLIDELRSLTVPPVELPRLEPSLLTVEEAGLMLSLSRTATYYALISAGRIGSVQIGTRRRVPANAIEAYIAGLADGAA